MYLNPAGAETEILNNGSAFTELSPEAMLKNMLSYVLPKNELEASAERLLMHFGSVSSTMEADVSDIAKLLGGNVNAASFLKNIPSFGYYYYTDKLGGGRQFDGIDDIADFCVYRFLKDRRESFSVLMLDPSMRMLGIEKLAEGTECQVQSDFELLGDALFRYGASSFILIHNHPGTVPYPSNNDIYLTQRAYAVTAPFNKNMMEHIIISGNKYVPIVQILRNNGYDLYSY